MQIRFKSLGKPAEVGYFVEPKGEWQPSRIRGAVSWGRWFPTYNDGLTQHGHDSPVGIELLPDFLASLASYIQGSEVNREEMIEQIAGLWSKPQYNISPERIRFLSSLRPKEGKTLYFSDNEEKVSTADSKRHDRRWSILPDFANGSIEAIYGLAFLYPDKREYRDTLEQYLTFNFIRETVINQRGDYGTRAENWLKFPRNSEIGSAVNAVVCLVESYRKAEQSKKAVECYLHNVQAYKEAEERQKQVEADRQQATITQEEKAA